ncbi:MAG: hypothetical protein CMJ64_02985, partial [Planctomycetaceae bacterium]|nr:hypothetical protein [Planctomycetaceae bacterium]
MVRRWTAKVGRLRLQASTADLIFGIQPNPVRKTTSTKRNLTKGAFTLKFYAFKVYTNSPESH